MLDLNYDARFDVLNIGFADRVNSIGDEEYDGLLVMRDRQLNHITSITIFGFLEKYKNRKLPLFPKEIHVDFEKEVVPFIGNLMH